MCSRLNKIFFILILFFLIGAVEKSHAFWIWTPETNKWVNPKYAVKDTPKEQLAFALEFYEVKEYEKAHEECEKLIKNYPKAREAAEAQYYMGRVREDQDKFFEAFKTYQVVIDKYPFSDRSPEIVKRQYEIGHRLMEGDDQESGFVKAFIGGDYNVIEVFRQVIRNAPYGEFAAPSQYKIGLYLQGKQLYQEARDEFEKVLNDYPNTEWAKAAHYQIALSDARRSPAAQYDQKVTQIAVEEFKKFKENYPDAELSDKAQEKIGELREKEAENNFLIGRFYEKQKNFNAARIYYTSIAEKFSDTTWSRKALERIQEINPKVQ